MCGFLWVGGAEWLRIRELNAYFDFRYRGYPPHDGY